MSLALDILRRHRDGEVKSIIECREQNTLPATFASFNHHRRVEFLDTLIAEIEAAEK